MTRRPYHKPTVATYCPSEFFLFNDGGGLFLLYLAIFDRWELEDAT